MAIKYSLDQKKIAEENYYGRNCKNKFDKLYLCFKKKILIRIKNYSNYINCFFDHNSIIKNNKKIHLVKPQIQKIEEKEFNILQKKFSELGFCYIENLFKDEFYSILKNNFPKKKFFYKPDTAIKNYNFGFRYAKNFSYKYNPKKGVKNIKLFPVLGEFYNYIKSSKEFKNFVNNLISKKDYENFSIVSSYAEQGCYLIPHIDSVAKSDDVIDIINIIYFVDGGEDAEYSGGTGIYRDNNFQDPVFIPKKLQNSALIYNSKLEFYHGFKIMKKDTFRKAVVFQFYKK